MEAWRRLRFELRNQASQAGAGSLKRRLALLDFHEERRLLIRAQSAVHEQVTRPVPVDLVSQQLAYYAIGMLPDLGGLNRRSDVSYLRTQLQESEV